MPLPPIKKKCRATNSKIKKGKCVLRGRYNFILAPGVDLTIHSTEYYILTTKMFRVNITLTIYYSFT